MIFIFIPILTIIILKFIYKKHITWWEMVLPCLPSLLINPLTYLLIETSLTSDTERWGGWVVEARYYEEWNEYIHRTCTRTVGSGKNTRTETYDCSYVQYHRPYWEAVDSNNQTSRISEASYLSLVKKFGNKHFKNMHRHYHTIDGDMYYTRWNNDDNRLQPVTTEHYYENRIQNTNGVFSYPPLNTEEKRHIYDYPQVDYFNDDPILGNALDSNTAEYKLQFWNAKIGRSKEVRIWILIFNGEPHLTGLLQEAHWKGGNKNEFIICVGIDNKKVSWCHPFCWSPNGNVSNQTLKSEVANYVENTANFSFSTFIDWLIPNIKEKFKRKNFDEFKYISIDPPLWAHILVFILTILSTSIIGYIVINNEYKEI